ncbi:MAG: response regulator transcription factor, partial [Verrucomicrobiales bacterium]
MRLLLIEDETPLRTAIRDSFADEGWRVLTAVDGREGLDKALAEKPDIIVLDIMLPKLDGLSLCRQLRDLGHTVPILMLTARGLVDDRVQGLDAGADDYMVKPFNLAELKARVRALRRRSELATSLPAEARIGDVFVDLTRRRITRAGRALDMTAKEWGVLALLIQHAGAVVTRDQFLDLVWGFAAFPTTRTVDTHIARLRRKLEPDPENPRFILTEPKAGYRLVKIERPQS